MRIIVAVETMTKPSQILYNNLKSNFADLDPTLYLQITESKY